MWAFLKCAVPHYVLMAIWVHKERGGRGFCICFTQNVSKKKEYKKKEENESSHYVLCWYKRRQCFWSHFMRVCNSQIGDILRWCLTVQTAAWTTEMKRGAHIRKPHIKRKPPATIDASERVIDLFILFKCTFWTQLGWIPLCSKLGAVQWCCYTTRECWCTSPGVLVSDKNVCPFKRITFWAAPLPYTLSCDPLNIWWGQYFLLVLWSIMHQDIKK